MRVARPAPMRALVTALGVLAVVGCSASPQAVDTSALLDRLVGCGLATAGAPSPHLFDALYLPDDCYAACLASGSCDELTGTLCDTSVDLRLRCDARCAHRCTNGQIVAITAVCDGVNDCSDSSDEDACPTFACNDGHTIPAIGRCNGRIECAQEEDEAGCANYCASSHWSGTPRLFIGAYYRCDGFAECDDGRDEAGCGTFVCDGGWSLHFDPARSWVCDGISQCGDGSDERGCPAVARLSAHCGP